MERWVPLLTNVLGKWVETSVEEMLPFGAEFSDLQCCVQWEVVLPGDTKRMENHSLKMKRNVYSTGVYGRVELGRGSVYWNTGDSRAHKG